MKTVNDSRQISGEVKEKFKTGSGYNMISLVLDISESIFRSIFPK